MAYVGHGEILSTIWLKVDKFTLKVDVRRGKTLLVMLELSARGCLDVSPQAKVPADLWRKSISLLKQNKIGEEQPGQVLVSSADRVRIALLAAQQIQDIKLVSKSLDWKDFEQFVSEIARQHDYAARSNVILIEPRTQIDVIAIKGSVAIVIDCKHWNKGAGGSALARVAKSQIKRARIFIRSRMARELGARAALPCVVTLLSGSSKSSEKVPIVPVSEISSFLADIEGFLHQYVVIKRRKTTSR